MRTLEPPGIGLESLVGRRCTVRRIKAACRCSSDQSDDLSPNHSLAPTDGNPVEPVTTPLTRDGDSITTFNTVDENRSRVHVLHGHPTLPECRDPFRAQCSGGVSLIPVTHTYSPTNPAATRPSVYRSHRFVEVRNVPIHTSRLHFPRESPRRDAYPDSGAGSRGRRLTPRSNGRSASQSYRICYYYPRSTGVEAEDAHQPSKALWAGDSMAPRKSACRVKADSPNPSSHRASIATMVVCQRRRNATAPDVCRAPYLTLFVDC